MERHSEGKRIITRLNSNQNLIEIGEPGNCRIWTTLAFKIVRSAFPNTQLEAREVDISEYLQHTFLKITPINEEPLLCDGLGQKNILLFFDYESEAPKHLQNSRMDILNSYLKFDNSKFRDNIHLLTS